MLDSQAGGSDMVLPQENLCNIFLQFVGCPPVGYEILLYHISAPPTGLIVVPSFMSLVVENLFWQVSDFFNHGCSADGCDFGVLIRGGELRVLLLRHLDHSPLPLPPFSLFSTQQPGL